MIWHEEEVGKHQPNALFLIYPWIQRMNQRGKNFFEKLEYIMEYRLVQQQPARQS